MLSSFHFYILILIVVTAILLFHLRDKWTSKFRELWNRQNIRLDGYNFLPNNYFQNDIESGLSSSTFNLQLNNNGDSRKGLDEQSKSKIIEIMNDKGITFDAARLEYFKGRLSENNIGPDGTPLDPRAFTFSSNKPPAL